MFKNPQIFLSILTYLTIWRNLATANKTVLQKCLATELYCCISCLFSRTGWIAVLSHTLTATVPSSPRLMLPSRGHKLTALQTYSLLLYALKQSHTTFSQVLLVWTFPLLLLCPGYFKLQIHQTLLEHILNTWTYLSCKLHS